jgi:ketosteroid isomerase-like protein
MSEANIELAREMTDRWNSGDVEGLIESSTPDFEFVPAIAGGVEGGSVHGPEEFRRFFADLDETWESFKLQAEDFSVVGDRVVITARVRAKGRASAVELDQPIFAVCSFRDGKMSRMLSFLDEKRARAAASQEGIGG